jgi:ribosome maturation factor RimP
MREPAAVKIEELAQKVVDSIGLELVEVEVKGGGNAVLVRVAIDKRQGEIQEAAEIPNDKPENDKPEGVTHGDCEQVSHQLGALLDAEDLLPGHYTLEVSSPGVERKLNKPQDYQRFQGQKAKITLREPLDGKRTFEGTLAGYADGRILLESEPGHTRELPIDQVRKANLKFEW